MHVHNAALQFLLDDASSLIRREKDICRVAIVGLGYVGLPTALAFNAAGVEVVGVDISTRRLRDIDERRVDVLDSDLARLETALQGDGFDLSGDATRIAGADAVIVCVPTPVDADHRPDLRPLEAACETLARHARAGQLLVLTSTSYVGRTREMLCGRLEEHGLKVGVDVHVAFAPERIDPGNTTHTQEKTPRVVGGSTAACADMARRLFEVVAPAVHVVSSLEAAEMTKLLENTFRAVNIAFAMEMADAAQHYGLDPSEVIAAAATKPYGFMPFKPSAGVGGHCIPADPHYILKPLQSAGVCAPLTDHSMKVIANRPGHVLSRARAVLSERDIALEDASVLVVGAAYKPGVADVRESPAVEILELLSAAGVRVQYHDPLVPTLDLSAGSLVSISSPSPESHDLVIAVTVHDETDVGILSTAPALLDGTYSIPRADKHLL